MLTIAFGIVLAFLQLFMRHYPRKGYFKSNKVFVLILLFHQKSKTPTYESAQQKMLSLTQSHVRLRDLNKR